ncbi:MAG: hypothetical protein ACRYGB_14735, partial [Janthinobacterium lividum]
AFKAYIDQYQKDFILFKTSTLLKEAKNDPIKKAEVIRDVVESIAKIPDSIKASVFVKECSLLMQLDERSLLTELNKMRLAKSRKSDQPAYKPVLETPPVTENIPVKTVSAEDTQEKEIVRLLITYGNKMIDWDGIANTYIGPFMIAELSDVEFDHPESKNIVQIYQQELENGRLPDEAFFIHHNNRSVADLAISMVSTPYTLNKWYENLKITVKSELDNMKGTILGAIFHLKKRKVDQILEGIRKELQKTTADADVDILLNQYQHMKKVEKSILDFLGSVVSK